ncbi:Putative cyclin-D7-1 [Linum perenne]
MEALLFCDEVWLCDPATPTATDEPTCANVETCSLSASSYNSLTKEECEEALASWMEKEANYVPEHGYVDCLHRSTSFLFARSRAIQWVLKACGQLNLSVSTVFSAANYLDRFMSMHRRLKWETWMVELVTVACLSVAAKFNETASTAPSLDDFQMEEMEHCFKPSSIQQVELLLLQALKWRVSSTTCYSYAELLLMNIANYSSLKPDFHHELLATATRFLLGSLLECKFQKYRPSAVAISAVWCSLEEVASLNQDIIPPILKQSIQKDEVLSCRQDMMTMDCSGGGSSPGSPVTVLSRDGDRERVRRIDDPRIDISVFYGKVAAGEWKLRNEVKKRKWEDI